MAKILVTKYGMKFYPGISSNPIGEQGETEGMLRHLVSQGHEVGFFGQHAGEIEGVRFFKPNIDGLNDNSTEKYQEECWAKDLEMVGSDWDHAIQVNGMAPTFSWIGNPRGALLQAFAVRYCGPWLNILQKLRLPRICINNDPRSYPRDQEMSYGWTFTRPAVLLDQWDKEILMRVGGKTYLRKSEYGCCESWNCLPVRENKKKTPVVIIAHSHFEDGIRSKGDWSQLSLLFERFPDLKVYGKGWPEGDRFPGPVNPAQVLDIANEAMCAYVVDHTPGFKTGKPYVLTSQGCVPCWNLDYLMWALDHYDEAIAIARATYVSDYSHLDRILEGNHNSGYVPR